MILAPPALLLVLIATACATLAYVLWGKRRRQLPLFWAAAFVGCLLAYGLGLRVPLALPTPAGVPILESVIAAWLLIIVASRLRV
jgi:uncharacterized integral membrane protein